MSVVWHYSRGPPTFDVCGVCVHVLCGTPFALSKGPPSDVSCGTPRRCKGPSESPCPHSIYSVVWECVGRCHGLPRDGAEGPPERCTAQYMHMYLLLIFFISSTPFLTPSGTPRSVRLLRLIRTAHSCVALSFFTQVSSARVLHVPGVAGGEATDFIHASIAIRWQFQYRQSK